MKSGGENQEEHKCGETTESVVGTTPYQTVQLLSVILTGKHRVAVMLRKESVVTQQNIVLVTAVQTTSLLSGGENQEEHKCGETTESVVFPTGTAFLTAELLSVILTERTRVVVMLRKESVVTVKNIVLVSDVQTTVAFTESGEN